MIERNDEINNEVSILKKIDLLPSVIVSKIQEYIPIKISLFFTREDYLKYHKLVKSFIPRHNLESYIREVVRRDNQFVFQQILNENYKRWIQIKNYQYKNIIYRNYIIFMKDYCMSCESNKCINAIIIFLEELGLCKNQHKKNPIKHIRWKN